MVESPLVGDVGAVQDKLIYISEKEVTVGADNAEGTRLMVAPTELTVDVVPNPSEL